MNDEGDGDAGDQSQCNGNDHREINGLSRLRPRLEDVEDGEWRCDRGEGQRWVDRLQDRGVDELGEVGHGVRRSGVKEHVHLELVAVLVGLEDLERAEAVWLRVANELLRCDSIVVITVGDVGGAVIANLPESIVIARQVLRNFQWSEL